MFAKNRPILFLAAVFLSAWTLPAVAATPAPSAGSSLANLQPPRFATTHHSLRIGGATLRFTATAGSLTLHNDKHQPTQRMFFVAFTRDGVRDESTRPVTFLYNGGPGSSSFFIEMGAFGPRRIVTANAQATPPAPYKLVNNTQSLLDVSDLVFIDAPGTGFSHIVGKGKTKDFYSVNGDAKAFVQFIRLYLNKYKRWDSPKFLLGESYGTTRSAALSEVLQSKGIALNGVILLSSILNFETASFAAGNDLAYELFLPSYAAVAWYHQALPTQPKKLKPFLAKVEQFATGEYAQALAAGSGLDAKTRADVARTLHQYTGLAAAYWDKANLRVNNSQFEKELLRNRKQVTGRLDARFSGWSVDLLGEFQHWDPTTATILPVFTAAFHHYLIHYLDYKPQRKYETLNLKVTRAWKWRHNGLRTGGQAWPGFTNVAPDLAMAMTKNKFLQVMVNSGYFDLGTPFFATDYTFDHLFNPVAGSRRLQSRIHRYYYQSGHMIYLNPASLKQFKQNVAKFMRQTLSSQKPK
jgi:carboxypeptidase C (cathepsin A)